MCFIIDAKHPNVKIARRDIPCYKRLWVDGNKTRSPYRDKLYHKNLSSGENAELHVRNFSFSLDIIHKGLHSYSNKKITSYDTLFIAYIPTGTKYYYDSVNKEYVSLRLVVTTKTVR